MNSIAKGVRVAFFSAENWKDEMPAFEERVIEFDWHKGMSWQVKQRSSNEMAKSIIEMGDEYGKKYLPLEVSTKSENFELGQALSAYNLEYNGFKVENIFQAAKVFNDGGPYHDILEKEPKNARRDCRIQTKGSIRPCERNSSKEPEPEPNPESNPGSIRPYEPKSSKGKEIKYKSDDACEYCHTRDSRQLVHFKSKSGKWPLEPKSIFYDYIYISALLQNRELSEKVHEFNVFTDIEFNQKVAYAKEGLFNCQARSCAIFVTLRNAGLSNDDIFGLINDSEQMKKLYQQIEKQGELI